MGFFVVVMGFVLALFTLASNAWLKAQRQGSPAELARLADLIEDLTATTERQQKRIETLEAIVASEDYERPHLDGPHLNGPHLDMDPLDLPEADDRAPTSRRVRG